METIKAKPLAQRTGLIACRASTAERLLAETLKDRLNLKSQSELVRYLLNNKAKALGIS